MLKCVCMYKAVSYYNSGDTSLSLLRGGLSSEMLQISLGSLGKVFLLLLDLTGEDGLELMGASAWRPRPIGGGVRQRPRETTAGRSAFSDGLGLTTRAAVDFMLFVPFRLVRTFCCSQSSGFLLFQRFVTRSTKASQSSMTV